MIITTHKRQAIMPCATGTRYAFIFDSDRLSPPPTPGRCQPKEPFSSNARHTVLSSEVA
jgi:hypothetical protein